MRADPDASPPTTIGAVEASIRRYTDTESLIHAFTRFDAEQALLLDAALGVTGERGPLARMPVAIKDIFDTAGVPTEGGSPPSPGRGPRHDAPVLRNLRAPGAGGGGQAVPPGAAVGPPG